MFCDLKPEPKLHNLLYFTLDTQAFLQSNNQIHRDNPFQLTLQKPNPTVGYLGEEELRHFNGYYHFRIR